MDIGGAEGSDYGPSGGDSSAEDVVSPLGLPKNVPVETASPRSSPSKDLQSAKWMRLRKQHNPRYLSLFREIWDAADDSQSPSRFTVSQIGAVNWDPVEKAKFFSALGKRGRHNLPLLAAAVQTKSEIEIKAYLDTLRQAELERQQFWRQTHNITGAEIPAAVEIGTEVESALDKAADALSAYQEQYDYAVASRATDLPYVVNSEVAAQLDADSNAKEQEVNEEDAEVEASLTARPHELFKMGTFCDLSTKLFMIGTGDCPTDSWTKLAEPGESPSLTQDTVTDFFNLVVGLSRRIIQTILFVAQSRIRATSGRKPLAIVRMEDVEAALDILGLEQSIFDFWVRFPRRRGLAVMSGSHDKGASTKKSLDLQDVELKLKEPHYRGRHSRSRSSRPSTGDAESVATTSGMTSDDEMSPDGEADSDGSEVESDIEEDGGSESGSDGTSDDDVDMTAPISLSKRKRMLEEEQDRYMEALDDQSRRGEEQRLWSLLELGDSPVNSEAEPPRKRPKVMRKTVEEVNGWQVPYLGLWEAYDLRALPDEASPSQGRPFDGNVTPAEEQRPPQSSTPSPIALPILVHHDGDVDEAEANGRS